MKTGGGDLIKVYYHIRLSQLRTAPDLGVIQRLLKRYFVWDRNKQNLECQKSLKPSQTVMPQGEGRGAGGWGLRAGAEYVPRLLGRLSALHTGRLLLIRLYL